MIPRKLELTNFLSYQDTAVLDLDGIHLACIAGANGSGKSSLLDAMTWALFGRSRARSDDDLINHQAALNDSTMEVRFTFTLEEVAYRVVRSKRPGKAASLELHIEDGGTGWKPLSERRLRETQQTIEQLLRLNYDVFTNASFLLQGKADEFTTRPPNQRKAILAELLGVTEWERHRERAMRKRKAQEEQRALLDGRLADIEAELTEEPARQAALAEAQTRRVSLDEKLQLKEQLLNQTRQTAAAVAQQAELVRTLVQQFSRLQRNLAGLQQRRAEQQEKQKSLDAILIQAAEIEAMHTAFQEAEAEIASWQEKANQHHRLQQEKRPHELQIAQLRSRLEQEEHDLRARQERMEQAQAALPDLQQAIADGAERLHKTEGQLAELNRLEELRLRVQGKLQTWSGERQLLQKERQQLREQQQRITSLKAEKAAVLQNKQEAEALLAALDSDLQRLSAQHVLFAEQKARLDSLRAQQQSWREDMEVLKERIERLSSAELQSACPLCGQALSEEHRLTMLKELQAKGRQLGDAFRANTASITSLEQEVLELQAAIQQRPRLEKDQSTQRQRLVRAEGRLAEIAEIEATWAGAQSEQRLAELESLLADEQVGQQLQGQLDELAARLQARSGLQREQQALQAQVSAARAQATEQERLLAEWAVEGPARLATVSEQLQRKEYAREAQEALAQLEKALAGVGYDATAHDEARARRTELEQAPARFQALLQARATLGPGQQLLSGLEQQIEEVETELGQQREQVARAEEQLQTLKAQSLDLKVLEDEVFALREEVTAATRQVGVAQQRLSVLDDLRLQTKKLRAEKDACAQRIRRLKFLEKSCGRQGVQALLIEQALPEIEDRANELLEQLTGGDMRVVLDPLRQLKTRDALVETLDISISDSQGERPYDNYSGGEQFRVNFAIRIALSQLLARRAGARLQTLVIDEGFGSQDPRGRQRLVEAINTVRDEFSCILVITHIDELRDAFPTRIEVEKGATGSLLTVV